MDQETKQYVDKAMKMTTPKYGDTPTDANQLTPKKYVTSVVSSAIASVVGSPGGSDGAVQYNNGGVLGGANKMFWSDFPSEEGLLLRDAALFDQFSQDDNIVLVQVAYETATTDATPTNFALFTLGTNQNGNLIEVYVSAARTGGSSGTAGDSAGYVRRAVFKSIAGVVTIVGSVQDNFTEEDQSGWDCTLVASGNAALVQVTGATNNNITWKILARRIS